MRCFTHVVAAADQECGRCWELYGTGCGAVHPTTHCFACSPCSADGQEAMGRAAAVPCPPLAPFAVGGLHAVHLSDPAITTSPTASALLFGLSGCWGCLHPALAAPWGLSGTAHIHSVVVASVSDWPCAQRGLHGAADWREPALGCRKPLPRSQPTYLSRSSVATLQGRTGRASGKQAAAAAATQRQCIRPPLQSGLAFHPRPTVQP